MEAEVEAWLAKARAHVAAGRWSDAIEAAGQVLDVEPMHAEARSIIDQSRAAPRTSSSAPLLQVPPPPPHPGGAVPTWDTVSSHAIVGVPPPPPMSRVPSSATPTSTPLWSPDAHSAPARVRMTTWPAWKVSTTLAIAESPPAAAPAPPVVDEPAAAPTLHDKPHARTSPFFALHVDATGDTPSTPPAVVAAHAPIEERVIRRSIRFGLDDDDDVQATPSTPAVSVPAAPAGVVSSASPSHSVPEWPVASTSVLPPMELLAPPTSSAAPPRPAIDDPFVVPDARLSTDLRVSSAPLIRPASTVLLPQEERSAAPAAPSPWDDMDGPARALDLDLLDRVPTAIERALHAGAAAEPSLPLGAPLAAAVDDRVAPAQESSPEAREAEAASDVAPAVPAEALATSSANADEDPECAAWMEGAVELFELGDFSGSLELVEKVLVRAPAHEGARAYLVRNEETLAKMYASRIGDLESVPRQIVPADEVIWMNMHHRAGFVLAQVDGMLTYQDLIDVSGMSRFDTLRILADLVDNGIIA